MISSAIRKRIPFLFSLALIAFLLIARPVPMAGAQTQSLYWERFDVNLTVQPDGDVRVVETQVIHFTTGTFTRGFAVIPTERTEGIVDVSLAADGQRFEESGSERPGTFYTTTEDGDLGVYWFFERLGPSVHTYELGYTVHGGLRIAEDGDKLQWKAIPSDRDFEVREATVTVNLPPGAKATEAAVTNSYVPVDWRISEDSSTVTFAAAEPIPPYQELEIGVVFTHGAVNAAPPGWQAAEDRRVAWETRYKPAFNLLFGALGILLLLGAPVGILILWNSFGRDPDPGPVPEVIAEPPSSLPPGMAGALVDERADMQDIVATLVDLARRGVVEIEEQQVPGAFGTVARDFVYRKKDAGVGLRPYERRLLDAVFGSGKDEQKLSALRQRFYMHVPKLQSEVYAETVREGFFRTSPESVRGRYQAIGTTLLVLTAIVGMLAALVFSGFVTTAICPFVGLGAFGLGLLLVASRMPVKTRKGAEETAKWLAFKRYLETIERQTDLKEAASLFDRYLPYAVAFGIDRNWVSKFSRIEAVPVPGWYVPVPRPITMGGMPIVTSSGRPAGRAAAPTPGPAPSLPTLQGASDQLAGGLQGMSEGLTSMLNSAGRVFSAPPPSVSPGGSSGRSGGYRGGGYRGGSFRSGGGGGGGRRGFG